MNSILDFQFGWPEGYRRKKRDARKRIKWFSIGGTAASVVSATVFTIVYFMHKHINEVGKFNTSENYMNKYELLLALTIGSAILSFMLFLLAFMNCCKRIPERVGFATGGEVPMA